MQDDSNENFVPPGTLTKAFAEPAPDRRDDDARYPVVRQEALTPGEADLIKGIFGPEIDISKVRKHFTAVSKPGTSPGYVIPAQTFSNDCIKFYGPDYTSGDYSRPDNAFNYGTFVHEMTHIWQNQHPNPQKAEHDNFAYQYNLTPKSRFDDLGEEQQASLIEDYALQFLRASRAPAKNGDTYLPSHAPDKSDASRCDLVLLQKVVEDRFPAARHMRKGGP